MTCLKHDSFQRYDVIQCVDIKCRIGHFSCCSYLLDYSCTTGRVVHCLYFSFYLFVHYFSALRTLPNKRNTFKSSLIFERQIHLGVL